MASSMTVQTGPLTSTKTWGGTDQQFQAALVDYIEARGLPNSGTNQQKLDAVVTDMWNRMKQDVVNHRRAKKIEEQRAALEAELAAELPF